MEKKLLKAAEIRDKDTFSVYLVRITMWGKVEAAEAAGAPYQATKAKMLSDLAQGIRINASHHFLRGGYQTVGGLGSFMIDPKLDSLPVDEMGDFEDYDEKTTTPEQAAQRTRRARAGLSINDTIAANASMSVGGLGADTSGVSAGAGVGAGTTYLGPGSGGSGSPAPTIVPGARAAGSTMRGEPAYELGTTTDNAPTTQEISALAYEYWLAKGCPAGSHEDDWRQAEEELIARQRLSRAQGA